MAWSPYLLFILLASCSVSNRSNHLLHANKAVSITYTGNMGVLIGNDKIAVWIDGPHQYYGPEYLNPPDTMIEKAVAREDIFNPCNGYFSHIIIAIILVQNL